MSLKFWHRCLTVLIRWVHGNQELQTGDLKCPSGAGQWTTPTPCRKLGQQEAKVEEVRGGVTKKIQGLIQVMYHHLHPIPLNLKLD